MGVHGTRTSSPGGRDTTQDAAAFDGWPSSFRMYYGPEFTSVALDHWAHWNRVQLDFSRPGKPVDNCVCEAFNGSVRRECLSLHWFVDLADAQRTLDAWKDDYNNTRPHSSLEQQSPSVYKKARDFMPRRIHWTSPGFVDT